MTKVATEGTNQKALDPALVKRDGTELAAARDAGASKRRLTEDAGHRRRSLQEAKLALGTARFLMEAGKVAALGTDGSRAARG